MELIVVGDVHGQFGALQTFLQECGCVQKDSSWQLPSDVFFVFLGDLVDRGPESRSVVATVRGLCDQGDAVCLMGNHEFNLVQYHSQDPAAPSEWLRPHSQKNTEQVEDTLKNYAGHDQQLASDLEWFRSLPLALEFDSLRCVHACWDKPSLALCETSPLTFGAIKATGWFLPADAWVSAARDGSPMFNAVEAICKGPECELPNGASYLDSKEHLRHHGRIAWWRSNQKTWRDYLRLPVKAVEGMDLDSAMPDDAGKGYPEDEKPVMFGHYWFTGKPEVLSKKAACIDYSCAKTALLVGYRYPLEGHALNNMGWVY